MQDANHIYTAPSFDVEDQVTSDRIAAVSPTDLVTSAPSFSVGSDTFNRELDFSQVGLSLIHVPTFLRIVPDSRQIALRSRSEPISAHNFFAATKASKSNSSASPLFSPATSAARKADICVS